jgi:uncharacterized protein YndB with AHSA1/START domain
MADLKIERMIDAPSPKVWKALTDPAELKHWMSFFDGFQPVVGHEITFKLGRDPQHQYTHISKVIEVIEGKKLTYGWRYDGYGGDSHVTFELFPKGGKTRVVLTHSILEPFPVDNPDFSSSNFDKGWNFTADGLKNYVEKQES